MGRSPSGDHAEVGRRSRKARRQRDELRGRLRPHDPFELIRWLALSQPDPRKALAELVQNSLDAGAATVRITRRRERGAPCLFVYDDGAGVIPEMQRPDALRYIATHIGHSRKRSLSPQERLTLMTQGQYGIGLLGFWSLGEMLEMRTAVAGQRPHRLVLYRDKPDYRIEPLRGRLALDESWTEVVVVGLHREAQAALVGRRAADYIGSELRGQLLARAVDLVVEDRMSRGRAQKVIPVRPPRFLGDRLEGIGPVDVPGYPPIRFEIYLTGERDNGGEGERAGLALYSAGTLVAESFRDLAPLGLDRGAWVDERLSGIVDFPGFRVAPGSRRGVFVDEAAGAFARAIRVVEPILAGVLEAVERQRVEELDRTLIRDLQRAFRDFYRHRPRYSMLPVESHGARDASAGSGDGSAATEHAGEGIPVGIDVPVQQASRASDRTADLLPPGPLDHVKLTPSPLRVECGGRRQATATAMDAAGRRVDGEVLYRFTLGPAAGTLETDPLAPNRVTLVAGDRPASADLTVVATAGDRTATATTEVEIVDEIATGRGGEGIPEPELVHQPASPWRSRTVEGRWQVNSGHREFRAIVDRPTLKLRYLAMLFAKEVVLRSHQDPRLEQPLEQLVEIAAYGDRRLTKTGRAGRARRAES
jgi:hypothetical protein